MSWLGWSWTPDEPGMDDMDDEDCQGDDEYYETASDEIERAMQDCGMLENGRCTLEGTEHCSFRCPFRHELRQ